MKILLKTLLIVAFGCLIFSLEAAGGHLVGKAIQETLELAAKRSGRVLSKTAKIKLGHEMLKVTEKYGDDVLTLVNKGGLEVLEQGARHGDDFWRLCKEVPEASRSLALHSDELLPLAKRIGPDVLKLEVNAPGLAAKTAQEFGDDGVRFLANQSPSDVPRLLGYASKADTQATKKILYETYAIQ